MSQAQSIDAHLPLLSEADFIAGFHAIGEERYHHKHPFHALMHEGKLTRGQLQAWALNRYYYQSRIPIKDAAILARSEDPAFRLAWRKRILDHDGDGVKPGGIEKWLRLVEATGLSRDQALRMRRNSSRHALRRPSLRRFRLHAFASRSRRIFPHRNFFKETHHPACRSSPSPLPLAIQRPRLFHRPPHTSPRRRRIRPGLGRQTSRTRANSKN